MPITSNTTLATRNENNIPTIYLKQFGEPGGAKNKLRGELLFIPLVASDVKDLPKYWDKELKTIRLSDLDVDSEVNTFRDQCQYMFMTKGEGGKNKFHSTKWTFSKLDKSLGDGLNDPALELGLLLPRDARKHTLGFGVPSGNFPPETFGRYITIPAIVGIEENEDGCWTGGTLARIEMSSFHWQQVKDIISNNILKRYTWYAGDKQIEYQGASGYNTVVRLSKDNNREKFSDFYLFSAQTGAINQHEVMSFVNKAYEDTKSFKEYLTKSLAVWKEYADAYLEGNMELEDAEKHIVASIANLVLTLFGHDFEMPTHVEEILATFDAEKHKLSYAQGSDIQDAIVATASGPLGDGEDSLDDDEPF